VLRWSNHPHWDLVESERVDGTFSPVLIKPTSPREVDGTQGARFYRLRFNGR
jgi:hypothetical protein